MERIVTDQKTGFADVSNGRKPITIYDFRGNLFYTTLGLDKEIKKFNLPAGEYFTDNKLQILPRPLKVKIPKLPKPERKNLSPENFDVYFSDNPNKCTIDWRNKSITYDNEFYNAELADCFFILYHEFGHKLYSTEKYADLYAARQMLLKGYNPSQIGIAILNSLSDRQYERKKFIIDYLLKLGS